ncbi:hypothetical protein TorRG33x02_129430 [Trema orientale]|uniref:F-box associated domain-containing protein n=1 Tax=Trema orientale TaxID=63057 RepID=A0A2P5F0S6_TREOI|nr:hypothetical protein TorRG33x02_129430 [Trema orientale]
MACSNSDGEMAFWKPSTRKYRKVPVSDLINLPFPDNLFDFGIVKDVDSALHWMVTQNLEFEAVYSIVAFDLVTEKYCEIELPYGDYFEEERFFIRLAELGGSLCAVCIYLPDEKPNHVDVWMMNECSVKESWTKLFSVVASTVTGLFEYVMPLAYVKRANQVVLHMDDGKFLLYDLEMERTKNMGRISGAPRSFETCVCVRNLVGFGVGDSDDTEKKAKAKRNKKKKEKRNEKKMEKQQSSEKNRDLNWCYKWSWEPREERQRYTLTESDPKLHGWYCRVFAGVLADIVGLLLEGDKVRVFAGVLADIVGLLQEGDKVK